MVVLETGATRKTKETIKWVAKKGYKKHQLLPSQTCQPWVEPWHLQLLDEMDH